MDEEGRPRFAPAKQNVGIMAMVVLVADRFQDLIARVESRKVLVPPHRVRPLQAAWTKMVYLPSIHILACHNE
jgi:hypothetical protein